MKITIATLIFALIVVAIAEKRCHKQEECNEDECCALKVLSYIRKGHCQKLATDGETCSDSDDKFGILGKKYIAHCPCSEGLICEPEEIKDYIFGKLKINERCVSQSTTVSPEDTTEAEVVEPEETEAPAEE